MVGKKNLFELKKCTVSGLKRQFDKWHLFSAPTAPPSASGGCAYHTCACPRSPAGCSSTKAGRLHTTPRNASTSQEQIGGQSPSTRQGSIWTKLGLSSLIPNQQGRQQNPQSRDQGPTPPLSTHLPPRGRSSPTFTCLPLSPTVPFGPSPPPGAS